MKKKYNIVARGYDNWQRGSKYCTYCGHRNIVVPIGLFNGKTGASEAWYVCKNRDCSFGKEYASGCWDEHSYERKWLLGDKYCKRCGKKEPNYSFV